MFEEEETYKEIMKGEAEYRFSDHCGGARV